MTTTPNDLILAPPRAPVLTGPVEAYLARLPAQRSRTAMLDSLHTIARVLLARTDARAGDVPWHQLGAEHVDAVLAALTGKYAPATVNRHLSALRGLIKTMLRMQLIGADAAARLGDFKSLKNKRPLAGRCLSMDEVRALFNACSGYRGSLRDATVLTLGYCAGLRRSEIAEVAASGYDSARGQITITGKGGKVRTVPLPNTGQGYLNMWLADCAAARVTKATSDRLVRRVSSEGRPLGALTDAGVYAVLQRIGARAGLKDFTPHDLRRTYITELLDRGHDPITVARLAGHDDVKTTMLYDRRPERVARAAADSLNTEVPMPLPTLEEVFTAYNQNRTESLLERIYVLRRLFSERLIQYNEVKLPGLASCTAKSDVQLNGSDDHKQLGVIAAEWLRQQGHTKILLEGAYFAGRYDLAPEDQSLFVECGDTPARKVIECCTHNKSLLIIPFAADPPRGFLFTRVPGSDAAWEREIQAQRNSTTNAVFKL